MFFQRRKTFLPAIGALLCVVFVFGGAPLAAAEEVFVVTASAVSDQKAVFATIESRLTFLSQDREDGAA